MSSSIIQAFTSQWLAQDVKDLLDQRNHLQVDVFEELISSHQELLLRVKNSSNHTNPSTASYGASGNSMNSTASYGASGNSMNNTSNEKYLATIQQLEQEISYKNAQIAKLASDQLVFLQDQKEFDQARGQFEFQVAFFTKRLEEEMLLNEQKDQAIKEFENALQILREEKTRHQKIAEENSSQNELLHRRISELEVQLIQKSQMLLQQQEEFMFQDASGKMESQEMANQMSQLYLDHSGPSVGKVQLPHRVAFTIRAHATEVNSVCYNQSGKVIFSASSDGTVRAWDTNSSRAVGEYRALGTAQPLICVRVSEDGEMVLGTGCDRKCFIWRVGPGRVIQTLTGHKGKVLAGEFFTSNSHEVITGASDRSMRVWDISKGKSLQTINCRSSCNDLALAIGGQFASAHQDGAVRFWDTRSKNMVHEMTNLHTDQVTCVSFASAFLGGNLLTNSKDHSLKLIDPRMFKTLQEFTHSSYQTGFDWSKASLSSDGFYATAGGSNGSIFVWNSMTGKLEKELSMGHQGSIACNVWRPDGQQVASCDKNGFLVLWDAA